MVGGVGSDPQADPVEHLALAGPAEGDDVPQCIDQRNDVAHHRQCTGNAADALQGDSVIAHGA